MELSYSHVKYYLKLVVFVGNKSLNNHSSLLVVEVIFDTNLINY